MAQLHPQTGPATAAGKDISSRNALTHGGTSEKLIVPGERQEDFDALLENLLHEYAPETPGARNLVEDAALARWFLWRRQRAFNSVESALYAAQPDPALWPPEAFHKLALLDRYKSAAERSLNRVFQRLASLHRAKKTASPIQTRYRPRHRRRRPARPRAMEESLPGFRSPHPRPENHGARPAR